MAPNRQSRLGEGQGRSKWWRLGPSSVWILLYIHLTLYTHQYPPEIYKPRALRTDLRMDMQVLILPNENTKKTRQICTHNGSAYPRMNASFYVLFNMYVCIYIPKKTCK